MKFLDLATLSRIDTFLDNVDVGEYYVHGDLEAYSCKLAGLDRKLCKNLEEDVEADSSPLQLSMSPVGPLAESSSRKTLIYLILTLNHIYPDYDFSLLRAHHFKKEGGVEAVEEAIDGHLLEVSKVWDNTPSVGEAPFLDSIWTALDEAIVLKDCDVYSYKSDLETDPFGEDGNVWAFNFFFYNKKMKRIAYFSCRGISKSVAGNVGPEDSGFTYNSDGDEEAVTRYGMANEMDL